jgi:hypothetical protein
VLGELVNLNLAELADVSDALAAKPGPEVGCVLLALAVDATLEVDHTGEGLWTKRVVSNGSKEMGKQSDVECRQKPPTRLSRQPVSTHLRR